MNYQNTLQAVDTLKALSQLKLETTQNGSYVYFKCPECQGKAVAKAYGEKKNLTYCTACKKSGHIISLVCKVRGLEWAEAVEFLKGATLTQKLPEELKITYDLQYHDFLKQQGITEETCNELEIGVPKGKTMLAGCVAFKIYHNGTPIAYYGIRMKDLRPAFHKSFNPETTLYHPKGEGPLYFTTSMFDAVKKWQEKWNVVCNFGLPYLSYQQMTLINELGDVSFNVALEQKKDFALQAMDALTVFYRFV